MKIKTFTLLFAFIFILPIISSLPPAVSPSNTGGFSGGQTISPANYYQAYNPTFRDIYGRRAAEFWPAISRLETDQCNATSDFIIMIPPGGCSPPVVRSDILAEQNVPVFCQLLAAKVNPLIDVTSIKSISFKGKYPPGVSAITFHPARAATRSINTLVNDPILQNIGYVVIVLERTPNESAALEKISGRLTARIRYDAYRAFGAGQSQYYLPIMSDEEWKKEFAKTEFFNGRGFLRARDIRKGRAVIDIYASKDVKLTSFSLQEGETSSPYYLPGYYCNAGLSLHVNDIVGPDNEALLTVDGNTQWVRKGTRLLNGRCYVRGLSAKSTLEGSVTISCPGTQFTLSLKEAKNETVANNAIINDEAERAFKKSIEVTKELLYNFPSEKVNKKTTIAEETLIKEINLARSLGQFKTELNLINLFLKSFPYSQLTESLIYRKQLISSSNRENAFANVYVVDRFYPFSVSSFRPYDKSSVSVDLTVAGQVFTNVKEGETRNINNYGTFKIEKVNPFDVRITLVRKEKSKFRQNRFTVTIKENEFLTVDGQEIHINNINLNPYAFVSIIPSVLHTYTEADFNFSIGIEKRAIQISPEKARKKAEELDKTIKKWEKNNQKLANLIKGMKGACFATSGVLMLKNLVSGEALARQMIMKKWRKKCETELPGISVQKCITTKGYGDQIERDVKLMDQKLREVNQIFDKSIQENKVDTDLLGGGTIGNYSKYVDSLKNNVRLKKIKVNGEEIEVSKLKNAEDIRAVLLYEKLRGTSLEDLAQENLNTKLRNTAFLIKAEEAERKAQNNNLGIPFQSLDYSRNTIGVVWRGRRVDNNLAKKLKGAQLGSKIQGIIYRGKEYILTFDKNNKINKSFLKDIGGYKETKLPQAIKGITLIGDENSCKNSWVGKKEVRFYETGPNKGLPAIIPLNDEGWYVWIPNSRGSFIESSPKSYSASAMPLYFRICNIGKDGRMNNGLGDDICVTFHVNTAESVDKIPGCPTMSPSEIRRLYYQAERAIREASSQYGQRGTITILGKNMEIGPPMTEVTGFECVDLMSAEDCGIMFNACDPVICPTSRCNLGGKMTVDNVVRTGIVGSIALCLPNFPEVFIPVCLTGVNAGIDAYLSVLKSYRDCLKTNAETGQLTGSCDEIHSIYTCQFFWREITPVIDNLLPSAVERLVGGGQSVRGGGEYLLVKQAFNNFEKSMDFFKNSYAKNAFRVFQLKNTEVIGDQLCKNFIGTSFPTSADALDRLLEPESPYQFYAQFEEIPFSDATVPPTSHYKVFYHIYAGRDEDVQFRVYLRNPPASSYYYSNPTITIDSGFIRRGDSASETIDLTLPAGYKDLCVVINAREKCGFRQVTSNFAIDLLSRKYAEEQATTQGITTEKECISGTPSLLPLISPNLQQGVTEAFNPDITLRGIVRICSKLNPSQTVEEFESKNPRWKKVGYCGNKEVICWLDTWSVRNDLQKLHDAGFTEGRPTEKVLERSLGLVERGAMTIPQVESSLSRLRIKIKELVNERKLKISDEIVQKILREADKIIGNETNPGNGFNVHKAQALAIKASVYRLIAQKNFDSSTPKGKIMPRPKQQNNTKNQTKGPEPPETLKVTFNLTEGTLQYLFKGRKYTTRIPPSEAANIDGKIKSVKIINVAGNKYYIETTKIDTSKENIFHLFEGKVITQYTEPRVILPLLN